MLLKSKAVRNIKKPHILRYSVTLGSLFMKKILLHRFPLVATAFCLLAIVMAGCGGSGSSSKGQDSSINGVVSTLAGLAPDANGTGSAASFNHPKGAVSDGTNLYVADFSNNEIRKIVIATGVVTTLAGSADGGNADGIGSAARFYQPEGITIDPTKTILYVADMGNSTIRKIVIATGAVTTLAGSGNWAYVDGTGTAASFYFPKGITIDPTGTNLYVADYLNSVIRKIEIATGVVTTFAGSATGGHADGTGTAASFASPTGITIDSDGTNLYVTDTGNSTIRKIVIATRAVSTIAGSSSNQGSYDGTGTAASFLFPESITTDGTSLYVADSSNNKIRKIVISSGVVSTLAGSGASGSADGTGTVATFNYPEGITADSTGANLYVGDSSSNKIRKIVITTGVVSTFAGSTSSTKTDGTGLAARFNSPSGIVSDGTNLYVADKYNNAIRKIVIATGVVTTLAGSTTSGSVDGTGTAARFDSPWGITIDSTHTNLYVVDEGNDMIRKIVIATGAVTTLAGSTTGGNADGTGTAASFSSPTGIVIDPAGTNLYVTDSNNCTIRKIVIATGVVTTIAGSGLSGSADGTGIAASFSYLQGIIIDSTGTNLYVADSWNNEIRKIVISTGVVTTLAGSVTDGHADGTGTAATFNSPEGITTDGTNLYVADTDNNMIRKIVISTGVVSTLAGSITAGNTDSTGSSAGFYNPIGITVDGNSIYIADTDNNTIRVIK
jgi:DNA-binding beta-propeller fold protein YncE